MTGTLRSKYISFLLECSIMLSEVYGLLKLFADVVACASTADKFVNVRLLVYDRCKAANYLMYLH